MAEHRSQVIAFEAFRRAKNETTEYNTDARVLIDSDGIIQSVDVIFAKRFGYTLHELVGLPFGQVIFLGPYITAKLAFKMKSERYAVRVNHRDGSKISCVLHMGCYSSECGEVRVLRLRQKGLERAAPAELIAMTTRLPG